jgi:hypothetical protein
VRVTEIQSDPWARWTALIDEPLVLAVINRADKTWVSAEAIAAEARLPLERVQFVLDTSPAGIIVEPPVRQGETVRYSTRGHYRATTGLMSRYLDALVSS